jgi:predicted Rossmann fold flavoprotein
LVVVGAGAAGMLTAIHAARAGLAVLLLETRPRPGAKIRVSGGGRCNVLPSQVEPSDFHTEGSSKAMRNALFSWPLAEVRAFFEDELGIPLKVEETGKVFPASDDAREVVDALLGELERAGVTLAGGVTVLGLTPLPEDVPGRFELECSAGRPLRADSVVIATGGLSLPKTGSDGAGYRFAGELGHELLPRYPALVPLLAGAPGWGELAGISLPTRLQARRDGRVIWEREGDLLFTHRGFSGPVVLDASHQLAAPWGAGTSLEAHWLGEAGPDWDERLRAGGGRTVARLLREELPRRLTEHLLRIAEVDPERKLGELRRGERERLVTALTACPLPVSGDEGYRTAEVTGGGVPLAELVTRTLESRRVPGLYFAGEVVDVTGRIGGFNFLWAWVSGRKVGLAVAARAQGSSSSSSSSSGSSPPM